MVSIRQSNETGSNSDLMRLSLEAAVEFDRLRRGQDVDRHVIDALARSLREPGGGAKPQEPRYLHHDRRTLEYLNHSPRTLDAYHRAWRSISGSNLETLHDLKAELARLLQKVRRKIEHPEEGADENTLESISKMEAFCLALNKALVAERPPRQRAKRMRV